MKSTFFQTWSDYYGTELTQPIYDGTSYYDSQALKPTETNVWISDIYCQNLVSEADGGAISLTRSTNRLLIEFSSFVFCRTVMPIGELYIYGGAIYRDSYTNSYGSIYNKICGYGCSSEDSFSFILSYEHGQIHIFRDSSVIYSESYVSEAVGMTFSHPKLYFNNISFNYAENTPACGITGSEPDEEGYSSYFISNSICNNTAKTYGCIEIQLSGILEPHEGASIMNGTNIISNFQGDVTRYALIFLKLQFTMKQCSLYNNSVPIFYTYSTNQGHHSRVTLIDTYFEPSQWRSNDATAITDETGTRSFVNQIEVVTKQECIYHFATPTGLPNHLDGGAIAGFVISFLLVIAITAVTTFFLMRYFQSHKNTSNQQSKESPSII